ncbi:MAG: hypothetical protein AAGK04_11095 [Planctomycetota bacterium]
MQTKPLFAFALFAAASTQATGAVVTHTDEANFLGAVQTSWIEDFESSTINESVQTLDFGADLDLPITSSASHNRVFDQTDGHGAINTDGRRAWKLARGATSIDLASDAGPFNAFGFWYSDLEWSDLDITLHTASGDETVRLADDNPNQSRFFGLVSDEPVERVTIAWTVDKNDGVGFDRMFLGSTSVPAPASVGLAALGLGLAVQRRGKPAA